MTSLRGRRLGALLVAVLAYPVTLLVTGALLYFPVLILAGPHSDLLPQPVQVTFITLCWLVIVALPCWISLRIYRRAAGREPSRGNERGANE